MMKKTALFFAAYLAVLPSFAQKTIAPSKEDVLAPFSARDVRRFAEPDEINYPETWFHFVNGNVEKDGITKDLEAIKAAGIRGVQFFHGGMAGGIWPGVKDPVYCLSENWEDILHYTASEAMRLGLRFTMQNCPGWSMSGGPWIKPGNAMRRLVMSKTFLCGGGKVSMTLPTEDWWFGEDRDYRDICVMAFNIPDGDGENDGCVYSLANGEKVPAGKTWVREIEFEKPMMLRTLVMSNALEMNSLFASRPEAAVMVDAWDGNGGVSRILDVAMPVGTWQESTQGITFALPETAARKVRITVEHKHDMKIKTLKLLSSSRKNGWEMQAGWTLYGIPHESEFVTQSSGSYIPTGGVIDISDNMDAGGHLVWDAPGGDWCIIRFGHVNKCMKNGPAPAEATGWECDKFSPEGVDAHFDGYIGKYAQGAVKGMLSGMLLDSWECETQTWGDDIETEFREYTGYELRPWMPALFGYVIGDQRTTAKFLRDWRGLINSLIVDNFYGRMAQRAHERGLFVQYETSGCDVLPCDGMEYYKHADVPMAEFWHNFTEENRVGSINLKVRPVTSAGHIYGKPRISAEAFTTFQLTWDEHLWQLKENANRFMAQGVTHEVFHTYTHNPKADTMVPGTSFGSAIGTPFLRGQTWWRYMPGFTEYLARCTYMLERGVQSMDVLWFLGDDMDHKPDQRKDWMPGYNYDYCNQDVLLNRLSVRDGKVVTPEGSAYSVIWWPSVDVVEPETLSGMLELVKDGAVLVTSHPHDVATLRGYDHDTFDAAMSELYGDGGASVLSVGKGRVYLDIPVTDALKAECIGEDVRGGDVCWIHRKAKGADWYFVASEENKDFRGILDFRCKGRVRIWDPLTGNVSKAEVSRKGGRTSVELNLERAESRFVVFGRSGRASVAPKSGKLAGTIDLSRDWTVTFPEGWGAPASLSLSELVPWKEMDMSDEGKAFSGTATYSKNLELNRISGRYVLNLGEVDMAAAVMVNGHEFTPLWSRPYSVDITSALRKGRNEISVEVTGTWFNRLVFDAGQEESLRRTWTISGPSMDEKLRPAGMMGPVILEIRK